jgi:hypothetical protein
VYASAIPIIVIKAVAINSADGYKQKTSMLIFHFSSKKATKKAKRVISKVGDS